MAEGLLQAPLRRPMQSIGLMSDLPPEEQAQRQQDVTGGLVSSTELGAMMVPGSGLYEMGGGMPDPLGKGCCLPPLNLLAKAGLEILDISFSALPGM